MTTTPDRFRRRRGLRIAAGTIGALLVVLMTGLAATLYFRMDAVGDVVARRLSTMTERDVSISGTFHVTPSLVPTVTASGLSVANAPWGSEPAMLTADSVAVELQILPLVLRQDVRIDRIVIRGADILLERGPDRALNWQMGGQDAGAPSRDATALQVSEALLVDSRVEWRAGEGASRLASVDRLAWRSNPTGPATISANGRYSGRPGRSDQAVAEWPISWQLDAAVTGEGGAYRIASLDARVEDEGGVVLQGRGGTIENLLDGAELSLAVTGTARSLAAAGRLFGADLPEVAAIAARGVLSGTLEDLRLVELSGRIGPEDAPLLRIEEARITDLLGDASVEARLQATGENLAATGEQLGTDLPALGPYQASGALAGDLLSPQLRDLDAVAGVPEQVEVRVTQGSVEDLFSGAGLRLPFEIAGPDPSALGRFFGWSGDLATLTSAKAQGTLNGSIDNPALQDMDAVMRNGDASVRATGSIGDVASLDGIDAKLTAEGPDFAQLSPLIDGTLPTTPSFRMALTATGGQKALTLADITASIGNSNIDGRLEIRKDDDQRPRIQGRLSAGLLDADQLWLHADEDGETGEPAPLDPPWLRVADAELALRADEVIANGRSFQEAAATLRLTDGHLSIEDLSTRAAGGLMTAQGRLTPRQGAAAEVTLQLRVEDAEVSRIVADDEPGKYRGRVDLNLNIAATGRTAAGLLDDLQGQASLFVEEGRLEDVPLNRMVPDLDITRILPFIGGGGSTVQINCLVGEFDVTQGVANTEAMLDTDRMTLLGEGSIDLQQQTINFLLRPMAKSRKLSTAEVPVDITGSLSDPEIKPRGGAAVGAVVRGVLGGLLIPLNQLTALFGKEATDACGQALDQARQRAEHAQDLE